MADFYLSPLRGITDKIFRTAYERRFGRFDRMVAPFVPTILGNRVKNHHIRDLLPAISTSPDGPPVDKRLIPQIIGREPGGFLLLSRKFADMGFTSVNWNLGCPAPLVAKKTRGCGLLPHKDIIGRFLDGVIPKLPLPLSIKTRLGYESPNDLEALIPLFNGYPIKELIIHPRTGIQLYGGTADLDRFESCLNISKHTVVYNGDIVSVDTFKRLADRFPSVNKWMLGRGIVMNPFLLTELREYVDGTGETKPAVSTVPAVSTKQSMITGFLDDILDACKNHPCPIKVLGRMKEIWRYLGSGIDGWEELSKRVVRCASLREYRTIIDAFNKERPS
ncbi:MAG: tRNA-dihydrouridine synthase family protein [Chitinispirillales bacterium]|jgi:tRNA-dihydrouridine synthase|nr:tRNA-dihydrouridine synthase family protein [Chitinispirillales bacterium]